MDIPGKVRHNMEFSSVVKKRKSTRAYTGAPITKEQLDYILNVGCAAPIGSAKYQTLRISVIDNKEFLADIERVASEASGTPGSKPLYNAPTLIVVSTLPNERGTNIANAACVIQNMHLAATDVGVASVYIWGCLCAFKEDASLVQRLGLPEGFAPVSALAVGIASQPDDSEREFKETIAINHIG